MRLLLPFLILAAVAGAGWLLVVAWRRKDSDDIDGALYRLLFHTITTLLLVGIVLLLLVLGMTVADRLD